MRKQSPFYTRERSKLIDRVRSYLETELFPDQRKPVEHLKRFFELVHSPITYGYWLFFVSPFLKAEELLELTDLGNKEWNEIFYPLMIEAERLPFPGLVKPLVDRLIEVIEKKNFTHIIQIGAGPMEIERQVITGLQSNLPVYFVGIDLSPYALSTASQNLKDLDVRIEEIANLPSLQKVLSERPIQRKIFLYKGDGLSFLDESSFSPKTLIFHSLFRHHLTSEKKEFLDTVLRGKGVSYIEFDGFKNLFIRVLASLGTWQNPIFLNSTVFSSCRYDSKKQINERLVGAKFFFPAGNYLFEQNTI